MKGPVRHYVVWRDKDGDVREVKRYRKWRAATDARTRYLTKERGHQENAGGPDVRIYHAESFDILIATHRDFDVWGGGEANADSTVTAGRNPYEGGGQ